MAGALKNKQFSQDMNTLDILGHININYEYAAEFRKGTGPPESFDFLKMLPMKNNWAKNLQPSFSCGFCTDRISNDNFVFSTIDKLVNAGKFVTTMIVTSIFILAIWRFDI